MYLLERLASVALVLIVTLLAGCRGQTSSATRPATQPAEPALKGYEYKQVHMGVLVRLVVFAPDESTAEDACAAAFARIKQLDQIMSDYLASSELNSLCRKAGGPPVPVSEDLFKVLQHAQELSARSNGAFDVTVGPWTRLWREARKAGKLPTDEQLNQSRPLIGWRKMILDPDKHTVHLTVPGMRLDLGAIGKGYAGDCALATLRQHGLTRAFFEAGGEMVVSDPPPGKPGWIIEVTNDGPGGQSRLILVKNQAVSTSGDTEQFIIRNGRRYSHILDPRSGIGLTESMLITIVAPNGLTSDALSTAVSVLGPHDGPPLAKSYNAKTYIRPSGM